MGTSDPWWMSWVIGACLKALLVPAYRSTDFEVHRNWMAVTYSRNPADWYADVSGQSKWTLDYPPLFALVEYCFARIAVLVDPHIVVETIDPYTSPACVWFQRCTVMISEFALLATGLRRYGVDTATHYIFAFGLASLLIVDHVHFQYNGFLLGVLTWSLASLHRGDYLLAAVCFSCLLSLKHLFLTLAPFFTCFLLMAYVKRSPRRLCIVGTVALSSLAAGLAPCLLPAAAAGRLSRASCEIIARLFPFNARGLVHSYWAPNVWALYAFLDRLVVFASPPGAYTGVGSTRGRVDGEAGGILALPQPTPAICFGLCALAMSPALKKCGNPTLALFHCALSAFIFGWHMHEKFAIVALLPLAIASVKSGDSFLFRHFSRLTAFAVLPLVPMSHTGTALTLVALEETLLYQLNPVHNRLLLVEQFHIAGMIVLIVMHRLIWPYLLPTYLVQKFEFLPLMLVSVYGACCFVAIFFVSLLSIATPSGCAFHRRLAFFDRIFT